MTPSLLRCACAGLISVFIGACETDIVEHDPAYSHPSTVQRKTARLDVGPLYAGRPNPSDSERIDEFLAAYQTQGERPLEVTVPGKSTDDPAAREHALQLANALMQRGVPAGAPAAVAIDRPGRPSKMRSACPCGGMVDAADSKSVARKGVLVRVRPGAPSALSSTVLRPSDRSR